MMTMTREGADPKIENSAGNVSRETTPVVQGVESLAAGSGDMTLTASDIHRRITIQESANTREQMSPDRSSQTPSDRRKKREKEPQYLIVKGDQLFNLATGEIIIIEDVRNGEVFYTRYLEKGDRATPGKVSPPMSQERFEVMRKTNGFGPVCEGRFNTIFNACQDLFERVRLLQTEKKLEKIVKRRYDTVAKVSQAVATLEDEWKLLEKKNNTDGTEQKKWDLLEKLQKLVKKLPETLVASDPVLDQVRHNQKEVDNKNNMKRVGVPLEAYDHGGDNDSFKLKKGGLKKMRKDEKGEPHSTRSKRNVRRAGGWTREAMKNEVVVDIQEPEILTEFKFRVDNLFIPISAEINTCETLDALDKVRRRYRNGNPYISGEHKDFVDFFEHVNSTNNRILEDQAREYLKLKNEALKTAWSEKLRELQQTVAANSSTSGKKVKQVSVSRPGMETVQGNGTENKETTLAKILFARLAAELGKLSRPLEGQGTGKKLEILSVTNENITYTYDGRTMTTRFDPERPERVQLFVRWLKDVFGWELESTGKSSISGETQHNEGDGQERKDQVERLFQDIRRLVEVKETEAQRTIDSGGDITITQEVFNRFSAYLRRKLGGASRALKERNMQVLSSILQEVQNARPLNNREDSHKVFEKGDQHRSWQELQQLAGGTYYKLYGSVLDTLRGFADTIKKRPEVSQQDIAEAIVDGYRQYILDNLEKKLGFSSSEARSFALQVISDVLEKEFGVKHETIQNRVRRSYNKRSGSITGKKK